MFFDCLCEDVVIEIISFLSTECILKTIPLINKDFCYLSQHQTVWKDLVRRKFQHFNGLENRSLEEIYRENGCDWKLVFDHIFFRVWDVFREDQDGSIYTGICSSWKPEKGTLFDETTYTYNNYYIKGPMYGDRVFRKGKHGFVFYHHYDCERHQLFGVISIKDEKIKNVKEYLDVRKTRFEHHDLPHLGPLDEEKKKMYLRMSMGSNIRDYHPIFKEVDFFGFCPITGRKVHNFEKKEDVILKISEDEEKEVNLSEKFRKYGYPCMKVVIMLDMDKRTIDLSVHFVIKDEHREVMKEISSEDPIVARKIDFGVLFDTLNPGAVVPVFFHSTEDYYKLYAVY